MFTQQKCVDVLKKQALVGTARKSLSAVRSYWDSTATQSIAHAVRIEKFIEPVTQSGTKSYF